MDDHHGLELGRVHDRVLGLVYKADRIEEVRCGNVEHPPGRHGIEADLLQADGLDLGERILDRFEQGLALCRSAQWREALAIFASLPDDPASVAYARRLQALADGAEKEWDAVWSLTEK